MLKGPMTVDFIGYSLSLWLSTCLEVTKQAVQAFLVITMIFPIGEVSHMPCTSDISSPRQVSLHQSLIKLDKVGSAEFSSSEVNSSEVGSVEISSAEVGSVEVSPS